MDNIDNINKSSYAHGVAGFLFAFAFILIGYNISDNIDLRTVDLPVLNVPIEIHSADDSDSSEFSSLPSPTSYSASPATPPPSTATASLAPLPPSLAALTESAEPVREAAPLQPGTREVYLKKGQTISDLLLAQNGIAEPEAFAWAGAIGKKFDARKLTTNTRIDLSVAKDKSNGVLESLIITLNSANYVRAYRDADSKIVAELVTVPVKTRQYIKTGTINSSFYEAAKKVGLPDYYMERMILHYSFDIDFQREIQKHDSFEIIYEADIDRHGSIVKNGKILSMSLTVNRLAGGKERRYFLYQASEGKGGFYDSTGVSVEKALLKTPIDGARLSSSFGYRKHPILGYTKLHKGVDFAAPKGTPIYAAGDGVVEVASRNGSYGKYIRLRHGGSFKTAYAHLSGYAKSIKVGKRVQQRQVIGYVGSTGRSTGPHLHYEIIRNGKAVNPSKLRLPAGKKLAGKELLEFKNQQDDILQLAEKLRLRDSNADNDSDSNVEISSADVQ